jgi:hypothetical protein
MEELFKNNMLKNYKKDENGVVYQINRNKFIYDIDYTAKRYDDSKVPVDNMSCLRLGYLISSLGRLPESLIDIGYGNGKFLKIAHKIIAKCYGYDIPPAYPLDKIEIVNNIYDAHYDVACFFDSLEHFEDIYEIKKLNTNYIFISVPWCHYLDDKWFLEWKHRRPDEHLWHFELNSLKKFMLSMGYEYICHSNIEDAIRKPYDDKLENILTALFKKC